MEEAALSFFKRVGLSNYEARVMVVLLRAGEGDVRYISEHSGVPRTKLYDVLEGLVKKGYVIKKDTRPLRFSIVDPEKILRRMLEERRREVERAEKELENVLSLLPLAVPSGESEENYVIKLRKGSDLLPLLKEVEFVGYTQESERLLSSLGPSFRSSFDIVVTREGVYIPLTPLGKPSRIYRIVVFRNPDIVDIFREWASSRLG